MKITFIVNIKKVAAPPLGYVELFAAQSMGTAETTVMIVQPSMD